MLEEGELAPDWRQVVLQAGGGTINIFLCSSCLYSAPTEEDIAVHAALHQASGSGTISCLLFLITSVPDPPDPHVFGPQGSGSGSTSQRYGSGSGFFYHKAKIVGKTLISTVLWLFFDFLSLKNDVKVPSKSTKQKNFFF
jgi:hypothetical protein